MAGIHKPLKRGSSDTKAFFDKLGVQLGYKHMDDWYKSTIEDIDKHGGRALLNRLFHGSPSLALQITYPEHKWRLDRFKNKPMGFWKVKENRRKFFDWLQTQLGYKDMDDWYAATHEAIHKNGGGGPLYNYYHDSPALALQSVYPEHIWMPWRFKQVAKRYWSELLKDKTEVKRVIDWLSGRLCIRCLEDWYRISLTQIRKWVHIGSTKEVCVMLQSSYPQHKWDTARFDRSGFHAKASQREAVVALQQLFPAHRNSTFCLC